MFEEEINSARKWLLENQSAEGGWSGPFPDRVWSGAWTTAGVILALKSSQLRPDERAAIKIASGWLIAQQNFDGGWPRILSDISSVESTAWVIMALMDVPGNFETSIIKSIDWLIHNQLDDGGWDYHLTDQSISRIIPTSFVISALAQFDDVKKAFEYEIQDSLKKAHEFLLDWQVKSSGWGLVKNEKANCASTALVLLAIKELEKVNIKTPKGKISNAINFIISSQTEDGSWPIASERVLYNIYSTTDINQQPILSVRDIYWDWFSTPWVISSLSEVGYNVASNAIQNGITFLLDLQDKTGAWPHKKNSPLMFWSTYQTVLCLSRISTHIDAKVVYKIFEKRLYDRDELIRQLKSDPSLAEDHVNMIREISASKPVIFNNGKGFYASRKLIISIMAGSVLGSVGLIAVMIFPDSLTLLVSVLASLNTKGFISLILILEGILLLWLMRKALNISKENLYVAAFGFIIGIIMYLVT